MRASSALWVLLGSLGVERPDGRIANRGYVIDPQGRVTARYDKIHLFDVDLEAGKSYRESATIAPGSEAVVAETPWGGLGLSVCYDLRFPQLYRRLAKSGATMLAVPAAFTKITGEAHWHVLVRARAIENGAYVFAPCQNGTLEGGSECFGHSLIVDPWGRVLADGGEGEGVILADVDPEEVTRARQRIPALTHDRNFSVQTAGGDSRNQNPSRGLKPRERHDAAEDQRDAGELDRRDVLLQEEAGEQHRDCAEGGGGDGGARRVGQVAGGDGGEERRHVERAHAAEHRQPGRRHRPSPRRPQVKCAHKNQAEDSGEPRGLHAAEDGDGGLAGGEGDREAEACDARERQDQLELAGNELAGCLVPAAALRDRRNARDDGCRRQIFDRFGPSPAASEKSTASAGYEPAIGQTMETGPIDSAANSDSVATA